MSNIELLEHKSSSYAPRTYHNAAQGVTLAVAVNHYTAGEKLTQKAAYGKIVMVDYGEDYVQAARHLYKLLRHYNCRTLNVAGNGIYTFASKNIKQKDVNKYIFDIINLVHQHWPLDKIVSGGQSGADIAGLVAGYKLGIPITGMWPKGYKMRFEDGADVLMDKEQVMKMIVED